MDEGLDFGSPNQLGDFWGRIQIKAYFRGRRKACVDQLEGELGKRNIVLEITWYEEIWNCWKS